jgi:hypothetical protein
MLRCFGAERISPQVDMSVLERAFKGQLKGLGLSVLDRVLSNNDCHVRFRVK